MSWGVSRRVAVGAFDGCSGVAWTVVVTLRAPPRAAAAPGTANQTPAPTGARGDGPRGGARCLEQLAQRGLGLWSAHQRLSYEHRVHALRGERAQLLGGGDARLGHDAHTVGDLAHEARCA